MQGNPGSLTWSPKTAGGLQTLWNPLDHPSSGHVLQPSGTPPFQLRHRHLSLTWSPKQQLWGSTPHHESSPQVWMTHRHQGLPHIQSSSIHEGNPCTGCRLLGHPSLGCRPPTLTIHPPSSVDEMTASGPPSQPVVQLPPMKPTMPQPLTRRQSRCQGHAWEPRFPHVVT